jgi:hypothetical protein
VTAAIRAAHPAAILARYIFSASLHEWSMHLRYQPRTGSEAVERAGHWRGEEWDPGWPLFQDWRESAISDKERPACFLSGMPVDSHGRRRNHSTATTQ